MPTKQGQVTQSFCATTTSPLPPLCRPPATKIVYRSPHLPCDRQRWEGPAAVQPAIWEGRMTSLLVVGRRVTSSTSRVSTVSLARPGCGDHSQDVVIIEPIPSLPIVLCKMEHPHAAREPQDMVITARTWWSRRMYHQVCECLLFPSCYLSSELI